MEAVAALGVASSVCQLIDFTCKIVSESQNIYRNGVRAPVRIVELENVVETIGFLTANVNSSLDKTGASRQASPELAQLKKSCENVAEVGLRLQTTIDSITTTSGNQTWTSFRNALSLVWKEKEIDHILDTLRGHREDVNTIVLVLTRKRVDEVAIQNWKLLSQSSKISDFIDSDAAWKDSLMNAIHAKKLGPSEEDERPQASHIKYVSGEVSSAANLERGDYLRQKFIVRLQFPAIRDRQNHISRAHSKTFEWVFSDTSRDNEQVSSEDAARSPYQNGQFAHWMAKEDGVFWVNGKPGSGKSTLMKYILEASTTLELLGQWRPGRDKLLYCKYFFWKAGHDLQKTQAGLLQTILYDAVRQQPELVTKIFAERYEFFDMFGDYIQPWSWPELSAAFQELVKLVEDSSRTKLFILIDGLDECEDDHVEVVKLLQSFASTSHNVKMIISSRPEQHIQDAYGDGPTFRMQDLTRSDITSYVNSELCTQPRFCDLKADNPQYAETLIANIVNKASGVFLWVSLVVRSLVEGLENGDRIAEMNDRFNRLPPELDELFSYILRNLKPEYLNHASHMFQLMEATPGQLNLLDFSFADEEDLESPPTTDAAAPLYAQEAARRIDRAKRRLNSRCKGLLEAFGSPATNSRPRSTNTTLSETSVPANDEFKPRTINRARDDHMDGPPRGGKYGWIEIWRMTKRHPPRPLKTQSKGESLDLYRDGIALSRLSRTARMDSMPELSVPEVDYLHRTAHDFLNRQDNWQKLLDASSAGFNPRLVIWKTSVLLLSRLVRTELDLTNLWACLDWCLLCAVEAESPGLKLDYEWIGAIDRVMSRLTTEKDHQSLTLIDAHKQEHYKSTPVPTADYHWANTEPGRFGLGANFNTFCVQKNLISFVAHKVHLRLPGLARDDAGRPMLDYLLLGRSSGLLQPADATDISLHTGPFLGPENPPSSKMVSLLIQGGADPNQWYADGTPWSRTLEKMHEFYLTQRKKPRRSRDSIGFQQWFDVFVAYIRAGADPAVVMNCPGGGSYAREIFQHWDLEKVRMLERLISQKKRWLPGMPFHRKKASV